MPRVTAVRTRYDDGLGLSLAPSIWYRGAGPGLYYPTQGIWTDLSGNGLHATPQGAPRAQPYGGSIGINNKDAVHFTGVANQALIAPATTFNTFTIFLVAQLAGIVGYLAVLKDDGGADGAYLYGHIGSTINVHRNTSTVSSYNYASNWSVDNVPRSIIWTYDGTHAGHKLYIGGISQTLTATIVGSPSGSLSQQIFIGASDTGTAPATGLFGEFRKYDGVLTAADIDKLTAYSKSHWAV